MLGQWSLQVKPSVNFSSVGVQTNAAPIEVSNVLDYATEDQQEALDLVVSYTPATVSNTVTHSMDLFLVVVNTVDPFILLAEVICALFVLSLSAKVFKFFNLSLGYSDLVSFCQLRGISLTEVFTLLTFSLGFLLFDAFVTLNEEDIFEGISYGFFSAIVLAMFFLALAIDIQYYYLISAISGGELSVRVIYSDILNNALCLLRIFFCWVRYLFYDLQSELIDLAFHYTEFAENDSLLWVGYGAYFDIVAMVVQLLIGLFKLALALFLFWLILDLFLLRTAARVELVWKFSKRSVK